MYDIDMDANLLSSWIPSDVIHAEYDDQFIISPICETQNTSSIANNRKLFALRFTC